MNDDRVTYGHYCIDRRPDGSLCELGRGAMGVTYQAHDVNLHCPVALKVIRGIGLGDAKVRERFVNEARAAARLRHRNIAAVFHLGTEQEEFYYAMELVDGETIEARVKRTGPLPPRLALSLAMQVAGALGAAGRQHLIHRDIKPANIMLLSAEDEEGPVVKVIDFGLVRPILPDCRGQTTTGFVGTPQYSSPEQAEERELDIRSDLYSLGCTLWFLLTGEPPYTGSLAHVFAQHLRGEPPWDKLRGVPEPLINLLAHLLEKDPERRPATPAEARREMELCLAAIERRGALAARFALFYEERKHWLRTHWPRTDWLRTDWLRNQPRGRLIAGACALPLVGLAVLVWARSAPLSHDSLAAHPTEEPAKTETVALQVEAIPDHWFVFNEPSWPDVGTVEEPFWSADFLRRKLVGEEIATSTADEYPGLELPTEEAGIRPPPPAESRPLWETGSPNPFAVINPEFGRGNAPFTPALALFDPSTEVEAMDADTPKTAAQERPQKTARKKGSRRSGGRGDSFDPVASIEKVHRSIHRFVRRLF